MQIKLPAHLGATTSMSITNKPAAPAPSELLLWEETYDAVHFCFVFGSKASMRMTSVFHRATSCLKC